MLRFPSLLQVGRRLRGVGLTPFFRRNSHSLSILCDLDQGTFQDDSHTIRYFGIFFWGLMTPRIFPNSWQCPRLSLLQQRFAIPDHHMTCSVRDLHHGVIRIPRSTTHRSGGGSVFSKRWGLLFVREESNNLIGKNFDARKLARSRSKCSKFQNFQLINLPFCS